MSVTCGYNRDGKGNEKFKTFKLDPALSKAQMQKEINLLASKFEEEVKSGTHKNTKLTF